MKNQANEDEQEEIKKREDTLTGHLERIELILDRVIPEESNRERVKKMICLLVKQYEGHGLLKGISLLEGQIKEGLKERSEEGS